MRPACARTAALASVSPRRDALVGCLVRLPRSGALSWAEMVVQVHATLRGREIERARLEELLKAVRAGQSAALVLRGEPGIGKTALLDSAAEHVEGYRFLRAVGVES